MQQWLILYSVSAQVSKRWATQMISPSQIQSVRLKGPKLASMFRKVPQNYFA